MIFIRRSVLTLKGATMYQGLRTPLTARFRYLLAATFTVALLALSAGRAHADVMLFATTFTEDQLIQINLGTGAGTLIGVIPGVTDTADLASFGGNLYALDQMGAKFDLINPTTAAVISSTTLGVSIAGEGGFTFDTTGNAFVSASQGATGQLFGCNVAVNNGCTAIDAFQTLTPSMDGLAVSGSGTLYGMSQSPVGDPNPRLYTINETTGATTLIGSTGKAGNNLGGLAFDPQNGVLYSAFNGELYTVNISTGAVTAVGSIGFNDISGLAFVTTAVPEPSSVIFLITILLGVAFFAKRLARNKA
jgi:uncharacterized protein DUF6923